jgi:hypothetical protein
MSLREPLADYLLDENLAAGTMVEITEQIGSLI